MATLMQALEPQKPNKRHSMRGYIVGRVQDTGTNNKAYIKLKRFKTIIEAAARFIILSFATEVWRQIKQIPANIISGGISMIVNIFLAEMTLEGGLVAGIYYLPPFVVCEMERPCHRAVWV
jgi:hypothetical protein